MVQKRILKKVVAPPLSTHPRTEKRKSMSSFLKKLDEVQEKWASVISKEIAERRFYSIEEVTAYAKVKLDMAISEMVSIQASDLEFQRSSLAKAYLESGISSTRKSGIASQLAELNPKVKHMNRLRHTLSERTEYEQLKNYMLAKYGSEPLKDFFENYLGRDEFKKRKDHKERIGNVAP